MLNNMIDRLVQHDEKMIIAIKNISLNEPYFDHLSEFESPVVPPQILTHIFEQCCQLLLSKRSPLDGKKAILSEINKMAYVKPAIPGDQIRIEIELTKIKDHSAQIKGQALVEGKTICEMLLTFSLTTTPSRPQIHPTASVHPSVILGKDIIIGPYSIISEHTIIGSGTHIEAHVMIDRHVEIGEHNHIYFGAVIGSPPQDIKYQGELAGVKLGDHNQIREYVTINRSTGKNTYTQVGSHNMLLTGVHIAHNCEIGNHCSLTNLASVGGHCHIEDSVIVGGLVGVHQFVRIGQGAMVGGYSRVAQDVPPFTLCEGNPSIIRGLNVVGLKRRGAKMNVIKELKNLYKTFYRSNLNFTQAIQEIKNAPLESEQANQFLTFIQTESARGINQKISDSEDNPNSF